MVVGWVGLFCGDPCPPGGFGFECSETCTCQQGSCDPVNGTCSCAAGYSGDRCEQKCQVNHTLSYENIQMTGSTVNFHGQ